MLRVVPSSRSVERRWLVPLFRLNNSVMAWECAACGKLFSISVADAESAATPFPPPHIGREFELHNCELQLSRQFSETD
jgi:hypothetical protein